LIGSGIAIWLLVQPPRESSGDTVLLAGTTPTTVLTPSEATAESTEATSTEAPATATSTPRPGTPTRTPTPEPRVYIVQEGDTLLSIAEANLPPGGNITIYANRIAQENGLSPDDVLPLGTELILP
jgi:hypothetical protein